MKTKNISIIVLILTVILMAHNFNKATDKNKILLDSIHSYIIADSLNAVHISELQLSLKEYKKYRAEDAVLINKLKAGKIEKVIRTKTVSTVDTLVLALRDTVMLDTFKCFSYSNKWVDINGIVYSDSVSLNFTNREELLLVENKTKKKFLFIKLPIWLFGYKNKQLDVISKSPNTIINDLEYINITN